MPTCEFCQKNLNSEKGLNIHIGKSHKEEAKQKKIEIQTAKTNNENLFKDQFIKQDFSSNDSFVDKDFFDTNDMRDVPLDDKIFVKYDKKEKIIKEKETNNAN